MNTSHNLLEGDFFTVDKWLSHRDRSYVGECLEARIIEGDFVRARCWSHGRHGKLFTLDMRDVTHKRLSKPFVESHTKPDSEED